jgi:hypothetical protein
MSAATYKSITGVTALVVSRDARGVAFISPTLNEQLAVTRLPASEFDERFTAFVGYPAANMAKLYASYAMTLGATQEALDFLGSFSTVSKQELDMATKAKPKPQPAKKAATKKPPPKAKTPPRKRGRKMRPTTGNETAAGLFCELIMAGKLTDDEIFAEVKRRYSLDDKKRGYVSWYRNHLKKRGQNPPAAKQ